ncbi:CHAT domain-containing protein [Ephemerocybe angulata]|uniref:CHAT domain-containing protein n=1 Tax=Ephemerocybe angulata TaxID=980116 RepID=A0A8H6M7U6_9AGAR|nr:CHAT domain-containing protein [Tulosesus angulatus]
MLSQSVWDSSETDLIITSSPVTNLAARKGASLCLTEIWVHGDPAFARGKRIPLVGAATLSGRWEVQASDRLAIELESPDDVGAIDCFVKNEEGEEVGFVHLDLAAIRVLASGHIETELESIPSTDSEATSGSTTNELLKQIIGRHICVESAWSSKNKGSVDTSGSKRKRRIAGDPLIAEDVLVLDHIVISGEISSERIQEAELAKLKSLGLTLIRQFHRTRVGQYLTEAISTLQKAVQLAPRGHVDLPPTLSQLGILYTDSFERTGNISDIDQAISAGQKGVALTPNGSRYLPARLSSLGSSFLKRYERTGKPSDIEEAIAKQRKALALLPRGHDLESSILNNHGNSLVLCSGSGGDPSSKLDEGILALRKAVEMTPDVHPELPMWLSNLGSALRYRFLQTGNPVDITEAISAQQRAIALTPEGHSSLPTLLHNLGTSSSCRFDRTGQLTDINEGIETQRKAIELIPKGHSDLPLRLADFALSYKNRFFISGNPSDLDNAIAKLQQAINLMPPGHTGLTTMLHNLGQCFSRRFDHNKSAADIAEAISTQREVVKLTLKEDPRLPGRLTNLAMSLLQRSHWSRDISGIDEAISLQREAMKHTPEGHVSLPNLHENLAILYKARYSLTGTTGDLKMIMSQYKASACHPLGHPRKKLEGAKSWARFLHQVDPKSPDIILAFDTALGLVAVIAGLEQTVQGRYNLLQNASGLALEAAAVACVRAKPDKALEWLEQGRCLVWGQLNHLRTPLDDLREHDEALAQNVEEVSKRLDYAGASRGLSQSEMSIPEKLALETEALDHLNLARQWEELLETVRGIPRFRTFLMPSPCLDLLEHLPDAKLGYVVVINVDTRRCDAIVLRAGWGRPFHIPLPNFSFETAKKYRDVLRDHLRSRNLLVRGGEDATNMKRGIRPYLGGKDGEDPRLRISKMKPSSRKLPRRIWWCPTGPLSFLPLHAAGIYARGASSESVLDYVVSSYTPSVTALTDRVKKHGSINRTAAGLFLTSQPNPNVRGYSPIPGTTKEVQSIYAMVMESKGRAVLREGDELTVNECLEHMKNFSSIHLACHGSQNANMPLQSRFIFHAGPLELSTILKSNLTNADLAFLSACQTSAGEETLPDEAVHLAAGMLAAGYQRVVASMSSIGDKPAQQVAHDFYKYLLSRRREDGFTTGHNFDGTLSAYALHHSIRELRGRLEGPDSDDSLLTWVPFVHFGY